MADKGAKKLLAAVQSESRLFDAVKNALATVGIKAPWEYTGIASTPDYLPYYPTAEGNFRKFAPGSQPVKAIIPHDVPQHIFDIKYYVRDFRRNNKYIARSVAANAAFDFDKMFASMPVKPEDIKYQPNPGLVNTRGY